MSSKLCDVDNRVQTDVEGLGLLQARCGCTGDEPVEAPVSHRGTRYDGQSQPTACFTVAFQDEIERGSYPGQLPSYLHGNVDYHAKAGSRLTLRRCRPL